MHVVRIGRCVVQIQNVINVVALCSGQKMTMPGMPEAIVLEAIVVRDSAFDTLAEVS